MFESMVDWLVSFALGAIFERWVVPPIKRTLDSFAMRLAQNRHAVEPIPDPPNGFCRYRLGNIDIPVMNLFGSPSRPFSVKEVEIDYKPIMFHQTGDYPDVLSAAVPFLVRTYVAGHGNDVTDNTLPRLQGYAISAETEDDKRGALTLNFGLTTFFTFLATNRSLDQAVIPESGITRRFTKNRTLRQAFVSFPYELDESILGNPVGVNVAVISSNLDQQPNDQIIIRRRSRKVASYRNYYQVSASGYVSLAHKDDGGVPNPFVTAVTEAQQEIADRLTCEPSDFAMIGVAVNWEDLDLNLYGYLKTECTVAEMVGDFRRDADEGWVEGIPFHPSAVFSHIAHNTWEPVSALVMCAALLANFDQHEVEAEAGKIPPRHWRSFLEVE